MTQHKKQVNGQALALAATLATLGCSVGVEVQTVLAAGPEAPLGSNQIKIGHEGIKKDAIQMKENVLPQKLDATQQKLPSKQQKDFTMPGVKPVNPLR
jgi:hypothetical protein